MSDNINNEKLKDFYEKAKEFTKDVGHKISKQASIQKKNLELLKEQDNLARKYRYLGEKAFQYFKKAPPANAAMKKMIAEIVKLNSRIKGLKIKIGKEKAAG